MRGLKHAKPRELLQLLGTCRVLCLGLGGWRGRDTNDGEAIPHRCTGSARHSPSSRENFTSRSPVYIKMQHNIFPQHAVSYPDLQVQGTAISQPHSLYACSWSCYFKQRRAATKSLLSRKKKILASVCCLMVKRQTRHVTTPFSSFCHKRQGLEPNLLWFFPSKRATQMSKRLKLTGGDRRAGFLFAPLSLANHSILRCLSLPAHERGGDTYPTFVKSFAISG